jgi:hypothetical protein
MAQCEEDCCRTPVRACVRPGGGEYCAGFSVAAQDECHASAVDSDAPGGRQRASWFRWQKQVAGDWRSRTYQGTRTGRMGEELSSLGKPPACVSNCAPTVFFGREISLCGSNAKSSNIIAYGMGQNDLYPNVCWLDLLGYLEPFLPHTNAMCASGCASTGKQGLQ